MFSTRGQAGAVSYDDLINGFVAMIEAIAKTAFGLPFLRELVKRGELNHEKALSYYLSETRAAIKQGLAKKEKKDMCSTQSSRAWASENPITLMKSG